MGSAMAPMGGLPSADAIGYIDAYGDGHTVVLGDFVVHIYTSRTLAPRTPTRLQGVDIIFPLTRGSSLTVEIRPGGNVYQVRPRQPADFSVVAAVAILTREEICNAVRPMLEAAAYDAAIELLTFALSRPYWWRTL